MFTGRALGPYPDLYPCGRRLLSVTPTRHTLDMDANANAELVADGLMTMAEVCRFLAVGKTTAYEMVGDGRLPSVRIGTSRRVPRRAVVEFASARLVTPPSAAPTPSSASAATP